MGIFFHKLSPVLLSMCNRAFRDEESRSDLQMRARTTAAQDTQRLRQSTLHTLTPRAFGVPSWLCQRLAFASLLWRKGPVFPSEG